LPAVHLHRSLAQAPKGLPSRVGLPNAYGPFGKITDLYRPNDPWREPPVRPVQPAVPDLYGPRGFRYIAASGGTGMSVLMRILLVGAGSLITLAGVIFALQGVGVIGGSFMSGTTTWAVAGPVIALAGLALVILGLRASRKP
jgi:hypothetical protein